MDFYEQLEIKEALLNHRVVTNDQLFYCDLFHVGELAESETAKANRWRRNIYFIREQTSPRQTGRKQTAKANRWRWNVLVHWSSL